MNILDIIVIGIILFFVLYCYMRGFAISVYNFVSFALSVALTNSLFPHVSRVLKSIDGIYGALKLSIQNNVGLANIVDAVTKKDQIDYISSLKLPAFIKTTLIENNNPEIYKALNVNNIRDYVVNYMANTIINIIAMIVVFIIVFILLKIIGMAIDIISRLPVINTVNKMFGAALGLIEGVFFVWVVLAALVWFYATNENFPVNELMESSTIAKSFHDTNFILKFVSNIFT